MSDWKSKIGALRLTCEKGHSTFYPSDSSYSLCDPSLGSGPASLWRCPVWILEDEERCSAKLAKYEDPARHGVGQELGRLIDEAKSSGQSTSSMNLRGLSWEEITKMAGEGPQSPVPWERLEGRVDRGQRAITTECICGGKFTQDMEAYERSFCSGLCAYRAAKMVKAVAKGREVLAGYLYQIEPDGLASKTLMELLTALTDVRKGPHD